MRLAPLVDPGPELTPEQAERFARHLPIPELGAVAQRRLARARVCVVGAGGLGSPALVGCQRAARCERAARLMRRSQLRLSSVEPR